MKKLKHKYLLHQKNTDYVFGVYLPQERDPKLMRNRGARPTGWPEIFTFLETVYNKKDIEIWKVMGGTLQYQKRLLLRYLGTAFRGQALYGYKLTDGGTTPVSKRMCQKFMKENKHLDLELCTVVQMKPRLPIPDSEYIKERRKVQAQKDSRCLKSCAASKERIALPLL